MDIKKIEKAMNRLNSGLIAGIIFKGDYLTDADMVVYDFDFYMLSVVYAERPFQDTEPYQQGKMSINGCKPFYFCGFEEIDYEETEKRD